MYALGTRAKGLCDRCGLTYRLAELKKEVQNRLQQHLKVCPSCFDPDHPQWRIKTDAVDYQGLREPRPDTYAERSVQWGWSPLLGCEAKAEVGEAWITTN
jgi:hypothetical protein